MPKNATVDKRVQYQLIKIDRCLISANLHEKVALKPSVAS